jgi:hypothetical protein
MANRKLLAIITVLMLAGGALPSHAQYTLSQLNQIENMINTRNWPALRDFVAANPGILDGESALASALKDFMDASAAPGSVIGDLAAVDVGITRDSY